MAKINPITRFVTSKTGQKVFKKVLDPKNGQKINSTLPVIHQAVAETLGIAICAFNPKIEPEQKKQQVISHVLKAGCNLTLVAGIAKGTSKFASDVANHLKTSDVVKAGVKVGFPLVSSILVSRLFIPVVVNNLATKIRDKFNDKKKAPKTGC